MSALLVENVRVALGELYSPDDLRALRRGDIGIHCPIAVGRVNFNKALRLAGMHQFGPNKLCICDTHSVLDRPDIWKQCGQLPVREALMGHVCGQP